MSLVVAPVGAAGAAGAAGGSLCMEAGEEAKAAVDSVLAAGAWGAGAAVGMGTVGAGDGVAGGSLCTPSHNSTSAPHMRSDRGNVRSGYRMHD